MSNRIDLVGALKLERLDPSPAEGEYFAVYSTKLSLAVPVPAGFDLNDGEASKMALDVAKQGARAAIYGALIQDLVELREKLPVRHQPKINRLIKQFTE
jgi:hypothetical protein